MLHINLGSVCEFGGEGKRRLWGVENMRENWDFFYIFQNSSFLENDKLMHMITIFLILKII